MVRLRTAVARWAFAVALVPAINASAQELPPDYQAVTTTLGKPGDYKDGVLRVSIPRIDLAVTIAKRPAPTPFGFGGWVALTKGEGGTDIVMGDLVLTEDEVSPVMSALLENGLDVTALHNHFFWEQPRIFFMHVHGMGPAAELARKLKPALDIIDTAVKRSTRSTAAAPAPNAFDGAALSKIIGQQGEANGPVYRFTIGREDIDMRAHGARINSRMGLNTWAAFAGSPADAMVAGDVAMLEHEVTPVLKALRSHGIDVVAIHHHMTDVKPVVVFLHYFGVGPAEKLATGFRAAVDVLGKPAATHHQGAATGTSTAAAPTVLFMCPRGSAKSVLASAYFQRLARERGLNVRVESAGTEPDDAVAPAVAAHLEKQGVAVPISQPRAATARDMEIMEIADVVISIGCDLKGLPTPRGTLVDWSDVPALSENFARSDEAIRQRVLALVDELAGKGKGQR